MTRHGHHPTADDRAARGPRSRWTTLFTAGVASLALVATWSWLSDPASPPEVDVVTSDEPRGVTETAHVPAAEREVAPAEPPAHDPSDAPTADVGRLELRFADESGRPVADVEVTVLRSDSDEPTPSRRSGDDGIVRFDDLEARPGYRWKSLSPGLSLDIQPPHESMLPRPPPLDGGRVAPELVTDRSGPFAIEAGGTTRFPVIVHRGTGIRGWVARRDALDGPIQLRVLTRRENPTTFTDDLPELLAEGPGFEVRGVPPAERKRLLVIWREVENRFSIAKIDFSLAEGEVKDLGRIAPRHETVVNVATAFELDGDETDVRDVLREGEAVGVAGVRRLPQRGDTADVIFNEFFDVTVGAPFTLHGLPEGEWAIDLHAQFGPQLVPGVRLDRDAATCRVRLPADAACRLVVTGVRPVPVPVEIVLPADRPGRPLDLVAVSERGRRVTSRIPAQAPPTARTTVELTAGRWSILVTSGRSDAASEASLWGETAIVVSVPPRPARVVLSPGRDVRGAARSSLARRDPAGLTLGFTLPRFAHHDPPPRIYTVTTDEHARFVIRGVPPGERPVLVPLRGVDVVFDS